MKKMKKNLVFAVLFAATITGYAQGLSGKTFVIQSLGPGANARVIDADWNTLGKNGTKIQLWDKNGSENQNWNFVYAHKGKDVYQIVSSSPKAGIYKYLDANYDDLGKNGGKVQLYQDANSQNQLWKVTKNTDDSYRIQSMHPKAKGACLDADGHTQNKNGGKVQMWQYLNNKNQAWKLISLDAVSNTLKAGKTLKAGQKLVSTNGKFMLLLQAFDGNLCVYKYNNGTQGGFVWCSMAHGFKNARLVMQTNGNLVVYDGKNKAR